MRAARHLAFMSSYFSQLE